MKSNVQEIRKFRDQKHVFKDRSEAGGFLAMMLQEKYPHMNGMMVLAIPSGGVPVGIKVKEALDLDFDLMIVRKLKIPGNPEAGFGAMAMDGTVFFNERLLSRLHLSDAQIEDEKIRVSRELEKRNALFRQGRTLPVLSGKKVILVDDGLASGYTMLASIDMVKKGGADVIIVAVPTASQSSLDLISSHADKIYCANIRTGHFFAVAEAYEHWYDLDEDEIQKLLKI